MELFRQAFTIMVVGMTLVFAFLAVVILAMHLSAWIIRRIEGEPSEDLPATPADESVQKRRAAAIAAALHRFRQLS
jgi:sodium pump decarboxylase gamma subunit